MPKVSKDLPDSLRVYNFHGLDLNYREGEKNATCDCMFCGRENKFNILVDTGQYRCVVCGVSGNQYVFIRELMRLSDEATTDYVSLAEDRGLALPDSIIVWGLVKSILTDEWMIPGYGMDGKLHQLYRYFGVKGKRRMIPTPTLGHQLFGLNLFDKDKSTIDLLEGPWDGLAFYEMLANVKYEDGYSLTANAQSSLLSDRNVLAIPGAGTFFETWVPLFADKVVNLWCQNDHVKTAENGQIIPSASYEGMKRIARMLLSSDHPPLEINYLSWGENGYTEELPHGFDIRDALGANGRALRSRLEPFVEIFDQISTIPAEWSEKSTSMTRDGKKGTKRKPEELELVPCSDWKTLINAWKKALKWTDGLDVALSTMLSAIASTEAVGDQLWIEIISPASSGKSVLCEAVSVNKKYVLAKSTIRGFHSGFGNGDEDNSLLTLAANKTLVTKDGDTLLQSPNLGQILAEARDVYDTVSRTHYRNKQSKNYEGVRMTWILCGTASLLSLDTSELGERFLKCIIMDGIDDDLEDEVLIRSAHSEVGKMKMQSGIDASTKESEEMIQAKALTGGYINYLRENFFDLLAGVEISDDVLWKCTRYGKFIAFMRARPSTKQAEHSEREFAARLVKQIIRLMQSTVIVLNQQCATDEVMRRVKKVTLNTSRGIVLSIVTYMYYLDEDTGATNSMIAVMVHKTADEIRHMMKFLRHIGVVEAFTTTDDKTRPTAQYRLTHKLRKLYKEVMG